MIGNRKPLAAAPVPGPRRGGRQRQYPSRWFFPAAMAHAAVFAPWSLWAMTGGWPHSLATGLAHGGEMLAGYALAVIAGFLLPRMSPAHLAALFALWLAGRAAAVLGATGFWSVAPNLVFAAWSAGLIVPRVTLAAKKLRNLATGPLVSLIATTIVVAIALPALGLPGMARSALYLAATLLAGLMLFMGGRVIVPALSGAAKRHGQRLQIRVQPRLESAMLLCLIVATAGLLWPALYPIAALGAIAAGLVSCVRLWRWRLWRWPGCADLCGLGIGYAWVATGMLLMGTAILLGWPARVAGLHAITIGGLGTLSLNVIGRTSLFRAGVNRKRAWLLAAASLLVSLAALARIAAIAYGWFAGNWLAATAWSLAFVVVLAGLWLPVWLQRLRVHRATAA